MGRGERAELDKILRLEKAARRAEGGDDDECVADLGIAQAVNGTRILERDDRGGARRSHHVAGDAERPGRLERDVADRHGPERSFLGEAGEPRPFEGDAHHLAVARRYDARAANGARAVVAQCREVDLGGAVEHEPQRVGAAKHRRRRRRRERESKLEIVALAAHLDRHRSVRIARTHRLRATPLRDGRRRRGCRRIGGRGGGELRRRRLGLRGRTGGNVRIGGLRRRECQGGRRLGHRRLRRHGARRFEARDRRPLGRGRFGLGRRGWRDHLDLLALADHDVDDVVVVLAETAHIDLADEEKRDRCVLRAGIRLDRLDHRRQRRFRGGEVEPQRRVEDELELLLVALRRNRDRLRKLEDVAGKGRLMSDPHAGEGDLALARDDPLLPFLLLRFASALCELFDHLLRQPRRRGGPRVRQQIDEQPLARHHRVERDLARQRKAHAHAVRVAARGADIARCVQREAIDRRAHRRLEADHQHVVGHAHVGIDLFAEAEDDAGIAAAHIDRDLRLHRLRRRGRRAKEAEQQGGLQQKDGGGSAHRAPSAQRARTARGPRHRPGVRSVGHDADTRRSPCGRSSLNAPTRPQPRRSRLTTR